MIAESAKTPGKRRLISEPLSTHKYGVIFLCFYILFNSFYVFAEGNNAHGYLCPKSIHGVTHCTCILLHFIPLEPLVPSPQLLRYQYHQQSSLSSWLNTFFINRSSIQTWYLNLVADSDLLHHTRKQKKTPGVGKENGAKIEKDRSSSLNIMERII